MEQSIFVEYATAPKVHISAIIFYVVYLGIMWPLAIIMYTKSGLLLGVNRLAGRRLSIANVLLVSGDTAMFLCWLIIYFNFFSSNSMEPAYENLSVAPIGIFSTSMTMSLYYFYLVLFQKAKFNNDKWSTLTILLLIFFLIRIILHYNPLNIWINMDPSRQDPNYTAWLRNVPLFIYGLGIVIFIMFESKKEHQTQTEQEKKSQRQLRIAMIFLVFSFLFYAVDIFFSHKIGSRYIWMTYTFKTIAYILAAWYMYKSQIANLLKIPVRSS